MAKLIFELDEDGNSQRVVRASPTDAYSILRKNKKPSLLEAIKERLRNPCDINLWEKDTLTRDFVLYCPKERPRFLKDFKIDEIKIENRDKIDKELRVTADALEKIVIGSVPIPINGFFVRAYNNCKGLLDIDSYTMREYGKILLQKNIDVIKISVVPEVYVMSHRTPFIRGLRLKGINSQNTNRGGICADVFVC
ncbi:hypothetical protein J4423_04830 [Candidatus Pacearchaeota archaeon]|nr:hypothetical protein [Candidatus Pacearchaeota archaeon]